MKTAEHNHETPRRLKIVLIKPSKYDDEGFVIRHLRGVLPSNTLACLYSLTEDVKKRGVLGDGVEIQVEIFDETVQKIPISRLIRSNRSAFCKTVIGLVGVQSNQFPRAADLARRFRRGGIPVMIGGFHVSGTMALFPAGSPEIQELIDIGVTIVKGEVEDAWAGILQDALHDRLKPVYDFLTEKPSLANQPVPMPPGRYLKRFIAAKFGTIDCSRGCPFNCSFCTIINVQGREMRMRSVESLEHAIRENYHLHGIDYYFFTDDNFARNGNWREVFEMMARLRSEGILVDFMIQVDTQSYKIPDFVALAASAGCSQVFIGMESINPKNLKAAGKGQNRVQDYKNLIVAWHSAKVATHVAYIIGFPYDTPESVQEDIERLKRELKVEQASFFMLTPIPGSRDHLNMVQAAAWMDPDLNNYDSFHETMHHPNFEPGEWYKTYRKAWEEFYSFEYMREVLANANPENYWNIFRNFIWYRNSVLIEQGHPMIHGFFRLKERKERRPGFTIESRLRYFVRRFHEVRKVAGAWLSLVLEMEELWLQTRKRSEAEKKLRVELERMRGEVNRGLHAAELQLAHIRARVQVPELRVPSRLALAFRDLDLSVAKRVTYTRTDLRQFWHKTSECWSRRQFLRIYPHKIFLNLLRDAQLMLLFAADMLRGSTTNTTDIRAWR
ncbi:MAG: radical SAM protein [Acidobacteriota bacterium]